MKKFCYLAISGITLILCSCNPAAKENERLQKEAQEYGENLQKTMDESKTETLDKVFKDIEPVEIK